MNPEYENLEGTDFCLFCGQTDAKHTDYEQEVRGVRTLHGFHPWNPYTLDKMRKFDTGATRDSDADKNDYEGFFSPLFLEAYGDYMTVHRKQSDGSLRASDNWQKGIPVEAYRKSLVRHLFTAWRLWRGWPVKAERIGGELRMPTLKEALCGIVFNAQGLIHESEKYDLLGGA